MRLGFEKALELMKNGKKVARKGWNGKGMYTQLNITSELEGSILEPFFTIKNVKGRFNTWVPSVSDLLATDWEEVTIEIEEVSVDE